MPRLIIGTLVMFSVQLTLPADVAGQATDEEGTTQVVRAFEAWSVEQIAVVKLADRRPVSAGLPTARPPEQADRSLSRAIGATRQRNALKGAYVGAPLGALAGAYLGVADVAPFNSPGVGALLGLVQGAAAGALIGALQPARPWWDR